ncbi:GNAT family N-acetyltransferase [Halopelagius longus]|uniref:GNAT family N-acetyltransferase n=1 Tax=Halopelagius longus TaxID=1236180 RepID=A0A1H1C5A5_9EURY|nr:GNAT family N-acetyltransferase [Halopelagius longus]RDI71074.1 GNAT family N-acetyltransferase [Halopelagius longus]SDQ59371.1 Ribosomal protein S18 acetylase RimI [Halopelagius longus]
MDVRNANKDDAEQIRSVAHQSLLASYGHAFEEETLSQAVAEWYDREQVTATVSDDDAVLVVGEDDGDVVAFAESYVSEGEVSVGEIDWLHVLPDYRGEGHGTRLLREVEQRLVDEGVARIQGRVLTENEAGTTFYEDHGFSEAHDRELDIGEETFVERIYTKAIDDGPALEPRETHDGERVFVAFDEAARGSESPFVATYSDESRESRYGWMCTNDDSFDLAMDTMGRIQCNSCGNKRKATRWDASYL